MSEEFERKALKMAMELIHCQNESITEILQRYNMEFYEAGLAAGRAEAQGLVDALEYYSQELPWKEVTNRTFIGGDYDDEKDPENWMTYKNKVRPASHGLSRAKEALAAWEGKK